MLKYFSKLETFLLITRERSFLKASAKLGMTPAAVMKKIDFIERYLGCKIIERKRNGSRLTSEGEKLYRIATKIEIEINTSKKDILKIINKKMTFRLGVSSIIGTYVIPGECLDAISESISNDVNLSIDSSDAIVQKLKDGKLDVGLIESRVNDNDLICRESLENELFDARIQGDTMPRKFFIAYSKKDKRNAYVDHVVDYILTGKCHDSV